MRASIERAGNWVFGTGLRADFESLKSQLIQAGSSISLVARLDQYYADVRHVGPYHAARKRAFAPGEVAPSTSVIVSRLQDPAAEVDVQVIAATSASGYVPVRVEAGLNRPEASGYTPCLRVGDMIFVAGQLARDGSGRLAAAGVKLETDYVIRNRLVPALDAAGSALDLVLKAQVYLSRPQDLPEFWEAWRQAFGKRMPPTTVVPLRHPAFLSSEATIEVNLIAAHRSARARMRDVDCEVETRTLDGLLFVGGLTRMDQAENIFAAAGTDMSNVLRALLFHSNLDGLRDPGFPFTAVETADGPIVDLWGYAPST